MKASKIIDKLIWSWRAGRPVFIWGAPGVGKSSIVAQAAALEKRELRDVRASLLDPVDLRGVPFVADNITRWALPCFLPTVGRGCLFLDELPQAPSLVQVSLFQLILNRRLGEYELPPDWVIVAAGNRETDRSGVVSMPLALANRFVHFSFDVDMDDWQAWALGAGVSVEVVAFLRFRPGLLHVFDPKKNDKAFPTPRTWEFVSDFVKSKNGADKLDSDFFELVQGIVGEGAAAEFMGFLDIYRGLPDLDAALMNPSGASFPDSPAVMYAVASALPRKVSVNNADRAFELAGKLGVEYQVCFVKDSVKLCPAVQQTKAFISWAAKNQGVLL